VIPPRAPHAARPPPLGLALQRASQGGELTLGECSAGLIPGLAQSPVEVRPGSLAGARGCCAAYVVGSVAPGQDPRTPLESPNDLRQCAQKYQTIFVILENRFALRTDHFMRSRDKGRRKIQYEGGLPWILIYVDYKDVTIRALSPFLREIPWPRLLPCSIHACALRGWRSLSAHHST
jgi:hypothetical protein